MPRSSKSLYAENKSISNIIRSAVTSKSDLEKLCRKLGFDATIDWIDNYDPTKKNNIMNIDADHIGGTHWVAIYNDEWYFDPLGLPVARDSLDYLNYTFLPLQDYRSGGCGLYCAMFLYYSNINEIDKFYDLFT